MQIKDKNSAIYLKFINLAQTLREKSSFTDLDPVEERLLNYFASTWHEGKLTTVIEAMNASAEISPSTVHRRLKTLRKKGYIALDIDEIDTRIKYIVQTELSKEYFAQLGEFLVAANSN